MAVANASTPLAMARISSKMTQEDMAVKLGVSVPVIIRLEKDPCSISIDRLAKWYHACSAEGKAIVEKLIDDHIFLA